jgi:transposase InsO family protein
MNGEGFSHRGDLGGVRRAKKRTWGALKGCWVPHDTRDAIVDFVRAWSEKTEIPAERFVRWLAIARGKYFEWQKPYGKANEHNALVPRDFWIEDWERRAILEFHDCHPLEGYRRLTFMMIDRDLVAVSPATTYRVLKKAGRLDRWNRSPSKKGTGFVQPLKPHEHWHVDISYINVGGTFFYLCSVLDGYSRRIVHWDLRASMTELEVEFIIQRAREKFPHASPRIISDNGPQFIARDFKEFIRVTGMTHVRTSRNYPQSNGKLERWHGTLKSDAIRVKAIANEVEARRVIGEFVDHYNAVRLHSAIGYIAPNDYLAGREKEIWASRDAKLEAARERRRLQRAA